MRKVEWLFLIQNYAQAQISNFILMINKILHVNEILEYFFLSVKYFES